ncbi:MAG TPA: L-fucokinase [Bryobacteraceae bacterium]|nr:L-fucokinase [Bryobacteraceae bacterium]
MNGMPEAWDYLVLTASNASQASAYEAQLRVRNKIGMLSRVRQTLVVDDIEGKRIGSGGSTLHCLALILNREKQQRGMGVLSRAAVEEILRGLRILIVHAGGDSRRLPAYGPCGKIFVPVPGESHSALGLTLFDRLVPPFLDLPAPHSGSGQVVVAAGDALTGFDAASLNLPPAGMTMLGAHASPEEASRHGVFCMNGSATVRRYLQKPSIEEQRRAGAIDRYGKSVLDIGVMCLDAPSAAALLQAFGISADGSGALEWAAPVKAAMLEHGIDLYREICAAMGTETTAELYLEAARSSGSSWRGESLAAFYPGLREIPFHAQVLPQCSFLHFGSTRQLTSSGLSLAVQDHGVLPDVTSLSVNNDVRDSGRIAGTDSWVEACRITAPLTLAGRNVLAGIDVTEPLVLPEGACLDVCRGSSRQDRQGWFIRCYGVEDSFKDSRWMNAPLENWLAAVDAAPGEIWDGPDRTLWTARVFPIEEEAARYRRWLWMFHPESATAEQKQAFRSADRYSAAEIATLTDQDAFYSRRAAIRASAIRRSMREMFRVESAFSADDLTFAMQQDGDRAALVAELLEMARPYGGPGRGLDSFVFCRIVHSLGAALEQLAREPRETVTGALPGFEPANWLNTICCPVRRDTTLVEWGENLRAAAFRLLHEAILTSSMSDKGRPRNVLRPDETIWGRGPARIELGGGWTDTPPYTLEYGGDVTNLAVNLNGQPPIHVYCRIIDEPVIRLGSIDGGIHVEIRELEELLDYRHPEDRFALAKAALAISGFSPELADWGPATTLRQMLQEFGGGIEITTLVGIPKGSGLGTSSILGAVIMAVIRRMMGHGLNQREIFHEVLRLEQALTTGGGWQDQIGGGTGGCKITSTCPGLFPDPLIHYLPSHVIDPKMNGGTTLLYYTGITRMAKNILEQVVAGYLNRNRAIMQALAEEHQVAHTFADALGRKDAAAFGYALNKAWELQKRLCGTATNPTIESLLERVRPYVHGMRIPGAGSGGFLLMACKSPADAARIREMLEREPLNDRSRFFDFEINEAGLEVTTC